MPFLWRVGKSRIVSLCSWSENLSPHHTFVANAFPCVTNIVDRQLGPVSQYMFNAYCGSLDGFFAQMVSYGILKEEDAQCFSVQGSIDPGSIALLVAAILLAFVNSVVTLASKQCLADYDTSQSNQIAPEANDDSAESSESESNEKGKKNAKSTKIRPPPFVFTDIHRWLLRSIEVKKDNGNV